MDRKIEKLLQSLKSKAEYFMNQSAKENFSKMGAETGTYFLNRIEGRYTISLEQSREAVYKQILEFRQ